MAPWGQYVNPWGLNLSPLRDRPHGATLLSTVPGFENTPLEAALLVVLKRNEDTGEGPTSVRAVAREMVRVREGDEAAEEHRKVEEQRRRLRRYLNGSRGYRQETRELIAKATRAELEEIPASPSRAELRAEVARLVRQRQEAERLVDRPQENP